MGWGKIFLLPLAGVSQGSACTAGMSLDMERVGWPGSCWLHLKNEEPGLEAIPNLLPHPILSPGFSLHLSHTHGWVCAKTGIQFEPTPPNLPKTGRISARQRAWFAASWANSRGNRGAIPPSSRQHLRIPRSCEEEQTNKHPDPPAAPHRQQRDKTLQRRALE